MRLATLLLALSASAFAQSAPSHAPREAQEDALFAPYRSATAPGCAVEVIQQAKVIFQRGYGVARLGHPEPLGPRTNFRLASLTKQFTAMAITLLVHDGKLRYDETLPQLFSGFPAYGRAITVRDLLHHTSGLADYEDLMDAAHGYVPPPAPAGEVAQISDAQVLKLLEGEKGTRFPPGTRWEYSNSGYVLLGLIVEQRSGMDFADFLARRIFRPLGMANTVLYERGRNQVSHRAYGHTLDATGWHQTDQSTTSATRGDGGIYTSLEDMAKWDAALTSRALLPENEMQAAWQPFTLPDGKRVDYGYGWFLEPLLGHARQWHYGETVGFRTGIHRFPADHLTFVVLCNRQDAVPAELIEKLAPLYLKPAANPSAQP